MIEFGCQKIPKKPKVHYSSFCNYDINYVEYGGSLKTDKLLQNPVTEHVKQNLSVRIFKVPYGWTTYGFDYGIFVIEHHEIIRYVLSVYDELY